MQSAKNGGVVRAHIIFKRNDAKPHLQATLPSSCDGDPAPIVTTTGASPLIEM